MPTAPDPTVRPTAYFKDDGSPLTIICPTCNDEAGVERYLISNPRVGFYDNRGIRKHQLNPFQRARTLVKKATKRVDGTRRITFYTDHEICAEDIIRMLYTDYGIDESRFPQTRGMLLEYTRQRIHAKGVSGVGPTGEEWALVAQHVYALIPDLHPQYGVVVKKRR